VVNLRGMKTSSSVEQRSQQFGNTASAVVVLAGYMVWLTGSGFRFDLTRVVILILLGLAFLFLGTWGEQQLDRIPYRWAIPAYFVVQLALAGTITFLTQGAAWLVPLPIVSQGMEDLPRLWGFGVASSVWALQVASIVATNGVENFSAWAMPMLAAVVFVAVFTRITVDEQEARRKLAGANQKLREYAAQVEEMATIQERNRLAREIHDGLGHYLTAINIQIKAAQAFVEQDPPQAKLALGNAQNLAQEALADVRRSISELRSDPSTGSPLPDRLLALLEDTRSSGLQAELSVEGSQIPLSPQADFTLFRVAQEGLTNVRKHASASQVGLRLVYTERMVRLAVCDNGIGTLQTSGGFGLTGLEERVQLIGGTLKVETAPGQGFTLEVEIPRLAASA
jgi:signal transduction histidine kinase